MSNDDLIDLTGVRTREGPRVIEMPARSPPLPKLWSEIEHLESKQSIEIFKQGGPLALLLYSRISELKLVQAPRDIKADNFIVPTLIFLVNEFKQANSGDPKKRLIAKQKID